MKHLEIASDTGNVNACGSCCCENVSGIPGTTDLWRLNYAPWVIPMGGKGLSTHFSSTVKQIHKSADFEGVLTVENIAVKSMASNDIVIDLSTFVDADGQPVTYELVPGYEVKNGSAELNGSILTIKSAINVVGFDAMMFRVTLPNNKSKVGEVFITWVRQASEEVPAANTTMTTPVVRIPRSRTTVHAAQAYIDVAVEILPTAQIGDIYRITFRANALDCDANCFPKETCYDLTIGKC